MKRTALYSMGLVFTALALTALGGCATPYQRAGLTSNYGYSVQRISTDQYRVIFQANSSTSSQQIQDFTYLAAAQVTLRHRYKFFEVLNTSNESFSTFVPPQNYFVVSTGTGYGYSHGSSGYHGNYSSGHWVVGPGDVQMNPGFGLLIKCFMKKAEADKHSSGMYDAKRLQKSLIDKYNKEGANISSVTVANPAGLDVNKHQ